MYRHVLIVLAGLLPSACVTPDANPPGPAPIDLTCGVADCAGLTVVAPTTATDLAADRAGAMFAALSPGQQEATVLSAYQAAGCPPDLPVGGDSYQEYYQRVIAQLGASLGLTAAEAAAQPVMLGAMAEDTAVRLVASGQMGVATDYDYQPVTCLASAD
jgi:hypothetical protein